MQLLVDIAISNIIMELAHLDLGFNLHPILNPFGLKLSQKLKQFIKIIPNKNILHFARETKYKILLKKCADNSDLDMDG